MADGSTAVDSVAAWQAQAVTDPGGAAAAAWARIVELRELGTSDRAAAEEQLNELFRAGSPARGLDGPTDGILVLTTTTRLTDVALNALTSAWMPWEGKRFDSETQTGDNRMTDQATLVSKALWPRYSLRTEESGKIAFDFTTYIEAGKDDPDREVMVIDYADIESNPRLLIRSIRDELVQLVPGSYLGKILYRLPTRSYAMLGYFALQTSPTQSSESSQPTPSDQEA